MSPPIQPYEPSSETGHLELLSEPSSPTSKDLRMIEGPMFMEDASSKRDLVATAKAAEEMLFDFQQIGNIYSPLRGIEDPVSSPPIRRPRPQEAKVEVPLTPPQSDLLPPWKRKNVSFKDTLQEIMPELPAPLPRPEDSTSDDMDRLVADIIEPTAIKAERSIEQEQLQEADTTHRVPVPVMDFSLPKPLWAASTEGDPQTRGQLIKQSLVNLKQLHFSKHFWPKVGATDLGLQWMPFPAALGRVETYETINDDKLLTHFLTQPECVDSSTLTWKREGLRILDSLEDSEGEELEEGVFPEDKDIRSLLRKRRLELEQSLMPDSGPSTDSEREAPRKKPVKHEFFHQIPRLSPRLNTARVGLIQNEDLKHQGKEEVSESFSALDSLNGFMTLRNKGTTMHGPTKSGHFAVQEDHAKAKSPKQVPEMLPKLPGPSPLPSIPIMLLQISALCKNLRPLWSPLRSFSIVSLHDRSSNCSLQPSSLNETFPCIALKRMVE